MKLRKGLAVFVAVCVMLIVSACAGGENGKIENASVPVTVDNGRETGSVTDTLSETSTEAESTEIENNNTESNAQEDNTVKENIFYIKVGGNTLSAIFENNSSADAFRDLLRQGDVTVAMSDYGDFEKVGSLGSKLPRNDVQITTVPGDVILYQGTSITIYYDTNTWSFTRLGRIEGATTESMKAFLGDGSIEVVFSLYE